MTDRQAINYLTDHAIKRGYTRVLAGKTKYGLYRITLMKIPPVASVGALPTVMHPITIDGESQWEALDATINFLGTRRRPG